MSTSTGTIVVGVDGSAAAEHALTWAAEQAVLEGRPLTLVHAVGAVSSEFPDPSVLEPHLLRAALVAGGQPVLDRARVLVERRTPGIEVHEILALDDPRSALLDVSEEAALLVVGSRGLGPVRSLLLGSVGVAVARYASCPVVIDRPARAGVVRDGVLAAISEDQSARPVLEAAYELASWRALPLTVQHYYWDIRTASAPGYVLDGPALDSERERLTVAEAVAGLGEKYPDVHVTQSVVRGYPEHELPQLAARMNLLVVGAHRPGHLWPSWTTSVSISAVEHAACAVLVVPTSA